MMNNSLATPDIRKVAHHPEGYIIAMTNENEVFRSLDNIAWNKMISLEIEFTTSIAISRTELFMLVQ